MLLAGCAAFIVFATLGPASLRPHTGHVRLERFGAFFLLGLLLTFAFPRRPWWALAAVCSAALLLEYAQLLAPGRHARLADALEKMAGGIAGAALTAAALALLGAWRARP